jgi:hypothetical protein
VDFFQVNTRELRGGALEAYPDFIVGRTRDLMVRARSFYAIWDDDANMWSTDEYDVQRLVDHELRRYAEEHNITNVRWMRSFGSNVQNQFRKYVSQISDNAHQLDENLTFANTVVKKTDYVSKRLPYHLAPGDISSWDELVSTLYSTPERAKIEWAIGSVIAGDSKKIQKFLVLYGPAGTGKSTILNIVEKLFNGYTTTFEAKALASNNNSFATEMFGNNPLVAIQHDGDLSKIEDNTKLNSIVSHEFMTMNAKYKAPYSARINALLLMGTNQPVRISDAKSGLIRRLIDVHPTGNKLHPNHYFTLMSRIEFELGAIAHHCLEVYRSMGKNFYNTYQPLEMMLQTDIFFNFVEAHYDIFKRQDGTTLRQAYALYKEFCSDTGIERPLPQYRVREELRNYFKEFHDRHSVDGVIVRSYYAGFSAHPFKSPIKENVQAFSLVMDEDISIFDLEFADHPAQLAKEDGTPRTRWLDVKTTLGEIDTRVLHYVKVSTNHIVIDFDLRDENGEKSLEKNLAAASEWPPTYGELSQSGKGVHLHYTYDGDVTQLARTYSPEIEIKVYSGDASLRRRLSKCNNVPISTISSGLPIKEKKVLEAETIKSERGLRELILRNLKKEIHPGTKPSIDFIKHILDEAYLSGMRFDVTDMRSAIVAFANNSTNKPLECLKIVQSMRWQSDQPIEALPEPVPAPDAREVFFDVEVFPNLFVVCWKYRNDPVVVRMINPSAQDMEALFKMKLIGFNCRRYDNHVIYAAYLGYDNEQLYKLSQKIIEGSVGAMFGEAYSLSYADIYDFSSVKKSLKAFEIELGVHHLELDLPWDQPVPEDKWGDVADYCANDVVAAEVVFDARHADFVARQILADLSGLSVNDTTQKHTARIIFGDDRNPQRSFVYTDLRAEFPGYSFDRGVSHYRGETVGEGGYVYAEPGLYHDVALLDIASMHPTSLARLNLFGDQYTRAFVELMDARLAIKRKEYDVAKVLLDGKLAQYLDDPRGVAGLADALKIVINIVYGLTSAKFDNPFRDVRNVDNIVAKRGALFMIDLKHFVQEQGFTVAHIKTDSIKIPNATPEIIEAVTRFGEKYGYTFEYKPEEDFYDRFCLVNDAVYIAKSPVKGWVAVGAQFQHPYVFHELFGSPDDIGFNEMCETKQVMQGAMHLEVDGHMNFVGRSGRFTPVKEGFGGGTLWRVKDGKKYAVAGTKGYLWVESERAMDLPGDAIDESYFQKLVDDARKAIEKFGSFEEFVT